MGLSTVKCPKIVLFRVFVMFSKMICSRSEKNIDTHTKIKSSGRNSAENDVFSGKVVWLVEKLVLPKMIRNRNFGNVGKIPQILF